MAINIEGLVKNIRRTNIYTPIIEGIVNAIEAIEDKKEANGKITIEIYRDSQIPLDPNELADIVSIKIIDNGIGFDENNRQSFDTLYSDTKIEKGGKGFGRFTFLKYFKNVKYSSNYLDKGRSFNRVFEFGNNNEILFNEKRVEVDSTTETGTTLELTTIRDEHKHKIDKRISTVSRRVLEHLLIYFIDDAYKCPEITIIDVGSSEKIVLNSYIKSEGVITKIKEDQFELGNLEASEVFQCKLFKLYFATGQSSVILTADNREVTTTPLYKYIPEFKDGFYAEV